MEKRVERLEKCCYEDLQPRIGRVEQQLAAGDVRFQEIRRDLEFLKQGFRQLTTWIQGAAITIGLGVLAAIVALLTVLR